MRALLDANRAIVADLDLALVLRRIVESAVDLVGARYGALAVVGVDGALEEFVHVGMDDESIAADRSPPGGQGTARAGDRGAAADPGRRPRGASRARWASRRSSADARVPRRTGPGARTRRTATSTSPAAAAEPFTAQDEELVQALAATAGVAIENARLFAEARLRQEWLAASTDVTRRVLAGDEARAAPDRTACARARRRRPDHRRPPGRRRAARGGGRGPRRGRHRGCAVRRVRHPERARHPDRQAGASGGRRAHRDRRRAAPSTSAERCRSGR